MRFIEEWKKQLPGVAGTLTGAFIIFVASTIAYRFRDVLYPPYEAFDYPLTCAGEAYPDLSKGTLLLEFYILNRDDEEHSDESLTAALRAASKGTDANPSPQIRLDYWRGEGKVRSAAADAAFNG